MTELEPCPFCGGYHVTNEGVTNKSIHCVDCGAYGPEPAYDANETDVVWNTRAAPKVKALEWKGVESDCYVYADTPIGTFGAMIQYSDEWVSEFDAASDKLSPKSVSPICSSMEEAKAAAQTHFEKLILDQIEV